MPAAKQIITADITVAFCNPKKEGKKNATIKTTDDQLFLVDPGMYSQFVQGGRYKIGYTTSAYNGATFKFVEKVEALSAAPSAVARHQAGKYGATDDATAERIYVCGMMNAIHQNQNIDPRGLTESDLIELTNKRREAWRRTFGNPQQDAELSDEIPF